MILYKPYEVEGNKDMEVKEVKEDNSYLWGMLILAVASTVPLLAGLWALKASMNWVYVTFFKGDGLWG